jgi:hypothetical protein
MNDIVVPNFDILPPLVSQHERIENMPSAEIGFFYEHPACRSFNLLVSFDLF